MEIEYLDSAARILTPSPTVDPEYIQVSCVALVIVPLA